MELGIPFSDPTAEGPVIQGANLRALKGGVPTDKIFDKMCIRDSRMTEQERTWLNEYHHTVYEAIAPHLPKEEQEWLAHATRAI